MKTIIKIVAAIIGTLLLACVAIAMYVYFVFDPNDFKQQITGWVKKQTGRELVIQGDIRLSLFPWLGVKFGHMTLGNAAGFGPQPFAELAGADASVRLLPLLFNRRIQTQTLTLDGLTLNLGTDKSGRTNWQDLTAGAQPANKAPSGRAETGEKLEASLAALAIGGINVKQARVNWDDRAALRHVTVDHINIRTGSILPNQPFDLRVALDAGVQPAAIHGQVALHGKGLVQPAKGAYSLDDLHLTVDLAGAGMPLKALEVKLRGNTRFDAEKHAFTLSQMITEALGATVTGHVQVLQLNDIPAVTGEVEIKGLDTRKLINNFTKTPILTQDSDVLGPAAAKISFDVNSRHVNVRYLHVELDDSTLNGTVDVSDYAHPKTAFNIHVDTLDLDRYLPPSSQDQPPAGTPAAAATAGASALPVETLRALNLDGELEFGKLKAAKLNVNDAKVVLHAAGGLITARPSAALYGGRYLGDIHLDARGRTPLLSFDESLDKVHVGPLLTDVVGDDLLTGDATVHAKFSLPADPAQLRRGLKGSAGLKLANGAVRGINIVQLIRDTRARLQGRKPDTQAADQQTDFSEFSATLNAADGTVRNNDLDVKTPYLRLTGHGEASLVTEHVDYRLDAKFVDTPVGQGGQDLADLKGVTIPIRVGGTLTKPSFAPDLQAYLKEHVETRVKKEINKQVQKQEQRGKQNVDKEVNKLRDKLKKNLDNLFR
jgi:AsmA protein